MVSVVPYDPSRQDAFMAAFNRSLEHVPDAHPVSNT